MGPHPYPWMVREFQRVIGSEARSQCRSILGGSDPDVVVACVGGGSNAAGTFSGFVDSEARLVGVEPAGGAAIGRGIPGVVHGSKSFLLQDEHGQVLEAHSVSAGLDYPGVGPEHAHLATIGRVVYEAAADDEVIAAFRLLAETEGIIPALEPAHALAWVVRAASAEDLPPGTTVLVTLSGRGDKDVAQVMELLPDLAEPGT
jgi:tryptophan synthase beta chain